VNAGKAPEDAGRAPEDDDGATVDPGRAPAKPGSKESRQFAMISLVCTKILPISFFFQSCIMIFFRKSAEINVLEQ
jgi:hypothetical protein